jgi:opine dehydrogenase
MRIAVAGAGPGGRGVAARFASRGHAVTIAELPEFADRLVDVRERGGVALAAGWRGRELVPIDVAPTIASAVADADAVVPAVQAVAHEPITREILPVLRQDAIVLFMGEGGGALAAWPFLRASGRTDVRLGETNCLPFIARMSPAREVQLTPKSGGVVAAAIPAERGEAVLAFAREGWSFIESAASVWDTALINFDAIDIVPVALMNAATIESRAGGILLWGEGATPAVVEVIAALDGELRALRAVLGSTDHRTYGDFLVAQGLAPERHNDLYTVMRAGGIVNSVRASGSREALASLLVLEVPYTLVLASSLGRALGVETPVIDALIALSSIVLATDVRAEGRTLKRLGLTGLTRDELIAYTVTGATSDG